MDCPVNNFLQLEKPRGRSSPLLADKNVRSLPVVRTLTKFAEDGTWVTCKECVRIGDSIIALEQQASWILVHTDNAFNKLCLSLHRDHKQIKSVRAIEEELDDILNPKTKGDARSK